MSTRAQICIKRDTEGFQKTGGIYIYKHHDGYPEGVMPILKPFVEAFVKTRGDDPDYLLCQIVREFALADARDDGLRPIPFDADSQYRFTGWGLDTVKHSDTEYLYEIDAETGAIFINGEVRS
jgi:hypothetical protein